MKPIRTSLAAAMTAAMLAAPVSSAEAHDRYRGHNPAGAFALGIISGAILGHALTPRRTYRAPPGYCYDDRGGAYYCDYRVYDGGPHYRMVPRSHYYYGRERNRYLDENYYYEMQRAERR